ncbi:flavin-containing monooxygenase [Haloglycomyces albus]|uniref:flavin-containing monooxygenase n=1 Tax=Haloglycomyces albus TaxID=526067 RepID=UPI00046CB83A|nr:FAD-dependent oxidoreductase [Haloglycomyces albus]
MSETTASVYDRREAVCVIGAGACGLIAIKNLRENGFEVDCYERDTVVGGLWNAQNQRSPLYPNTHLATPRNLTEIPDFPMPDHWPDFPSAEQMETYLRDYAEHFDLTGHIWFGSQVMGIEKASGSRFDVLLKSTIPGQPERRMRYGAVILATGHHRIPFLPEIPGQDSFPGEIVHSSRIGDPAKWKNKNVVIVGGGVSGTDIACLAAPLTRRCLHSTRRPYRYLPKYLNGRPAQIARLRAVRTPRWDRWGWLARRKHKRLIAPELKVARHLGAVPPQHPQLLETIYNAHYLESVGEGAIERRPDITAIEGNRVRFSDDDVIDADVIVCATGFEAGLEPCPPELLGGDQPRLLANMFSPEAETLAFLGAVETDSALLPIAHWQSHVISHWLRVRQGEPDTAVAFRQAVVAESGHQTESSQRTSQRHSLAVDGEKYLQSLGRIIAALEEENTA